MQAATTFTYDLTSERQVAPKNANSLLTRRSLCYRLIVDMHCNVSATAAQVEQAVDREYWVAWPWPIHLVDL